MTKITFRQKTPEKMQADAAARQRREPTATKIEEEPSAVVPPAPEAEAAIPAVAAEGSGFALDAEPAPRKPNKRKKIVP